MARPAFIYLDNHATTAVDPRVAEAMIPYLTEHFGNPASSGHSMGWFAKEAVELAREEVASLVGASPKEIVFTSGATESTNLAIIGAARANQHRGKHLITLSTEHKATLDACEALEPEGFETTVVPVQETGLVDLETLADAIREDTILVSVLMANNEIGSLQPVDAIGALCRDRGVLFHADVAQATGKIPVDVVEMSADMLSITAHKMHGPKGIGALYVRRGRPRVKLSPLIHGGGQERGLRSGTLATHQIVGLGKSCLYAKEALSNGEVDRLKSLRDRLWEILLQGIPGIALNASMEQRLPNNLNVSIPDVDAKALLMATRKVSVSSGSACASSSLTPSHVLQALGRSDREQHTAIRFGIGRFNTREEIEEAGALFVEKVAEVRALEASMGL
ncbi:MAG: aminotransferase class V-fold PLP-dependent enzyme [Myxococcota bacterium]|nr:aminotransferase class V-fold PLP-dependent enzyme [Myxococcota bacterium]